MYLCHMSVPFLKIATSDIQKKTLKFSVESQNSDLFMVSKYSSVRGINTAILYHHYEDSPNAKSVAKDISRKTSVMHLTSLSGITLVALKIISRSVYNL